MPVSGPILVFLANGTQGSAVMRAARQRGHVVRPLICTRSNDSPADAVDADLDDPASLNAAARGCAHAVLQVPTTAEAVMVRRTESALGALCHAGVRSIVLKLASASRSAPCEEPSFVANAAIEALVRRAGIPFAIVRPTMYLDNMLKPSARADIIERGVFSPPIARDQRIAWTSVDDCALGAVRLLEQDCYGGDHLICGPESVTGDELAARLSVGFGKPIFYHAEPLEIFERDLGAAMGSGPGQRIVSKFRYWREHPEDADRILGAFQKPALLPDFHPNTIEAWARERRHPFW